MQRTSIRLTRLWRAALAAPGKSRNPLEPQTNLPARISLVQLAGAAAAVALSVAVLPAHGQTRDTTPVLNRLESFEAPPFPASKYIDRETYDYRKRDGIQVPAKPMALVLDVCLLIRKELTPDFRPMRAAEDDVRAALGIYENRPWEKIVGYRPWTEWNFVRSLSAEERAALAKEVTVTLRQSVSADECTGR